jgi:hypothetical protein
MVCAYVPVIDSGLVDCMSVLCFLPVTCVRWQTLLSVCCSSSGLSGSAQPCLSGVLSSAAALTARNKSLHGVDEQRQAHPQPQAVESQAAATAERRAALWLLNGKDVAALLVLWSCYISPESVVCIAEVLALLARTPRVRKLHLSCRSTCTCCTHAATAACLTQATCT